MERMRDVLNNLLDETTPKEVIARLEAEFQLESKGIKVKYNKKKNEYSLSVSSVKSRREIESMVFRVLMTNKS